MRGTSHIASGLVAWPATYPLMASLTDTSITTTGVLAGGVVCAAAALVPDIDHPNGTIAHTYGPVSRGIARVTSLLAGGHRAATHSLLFTAAVAVGLSFAPPAVMYVLSGILAGFLVRGLGIFPPGFGQRHKVLFASVASAAVTGVMFVLAPEWSWFPAAVTVGVFTHLLGDTLTPGGVPYAWPVPYRVRLPLLSESGSTTEQVVLTPLMAVAGIAWMVWLLV